MRHSLLFTGRRTPGPASQAPVLPDLLPYAPGNAPPPDGIPTAPGALPGAGHAVRLLRDPLRFISGLPRHGRLVRIRLGPFQAVVVCDPGLVRQVLADDRLFDKGGPLFDRARAMVGNGLGSCPHREHRRQRRLVQPAFHPARMPGYAAVMTEHIERVTGRWNDGGIVDVTAEMQDIAAGVTFGTLLAGGTDRDTLQRCVADARTCLTGAYRRMFLPAPLDMLPTPGNVRYAGASRRLRASMKGLVEARRAEGTDRGDLLSVLTGVHRDRDGGNGREKGGRDAPFSDAEVIDQALTFFGAGWETTAGTLAWALHLLAGRPDVQQRLHLEADDVLDGGPAGFEHLPRLTVTGRIVTETLRMYPPLWLLTRTVGSATELGGHPLPAGTTVIYSPYLLHHRPDLYPDPERFDPDRWERDQPRDAYVAFGAGARRCAGQTFAVTEATLALATIASRWRLLPVPGGAPRARPSLTISPERLRMRTMSRAAALAGV